MRIITATNNSFLAARRYAQRFQLGRVGVRQRSKLRHHWILAAQCIQRERKPGLTTVGILVSSTDRNPLL